MRRSSMERTHSFDETPTPTRFIRNCEEIGLFQDLQLANPFDETFRIAAESSPCDVSNVLRESLSKPVTEETLNTPKIITVPKSENFSNIFSIVEEDDCGDFIISPDHFLVESIDAESTGADKDNNVSDGSEDIEVIEEPIQQNGFAAHVKVPTPTSVNAIVSALTSNNANTITYTINSNAIKNGTLGNLIIQTGPPITSNSNNSLRSGSNNKQLVLPKTVIATTENRCEETSKLNSSNIVKAVSVRESEFVYKLCNTKLPTLSGKNVVILPSQNHLTKPVTSQPVGVALENDDQEVIQRMEIDSDVKKKLRDLLTVNSSPLVDEPVFREGRKRSITESTSSTSLVVDDKREYSRERNRMAQKRCRMKKKKWIMQMKKSAELVLNENQKLQDEVGTLKAEIGHLKTLLLAHRNCSVTRAMFKADLSAILNNDISDIAENVEIPVPDSTDDCEEVKINYNSVVSHQQVNQVNHHVNHIHLHVPPSPQSSEDTFDAVCSRSRSGQREMKQVTQTRKLIFDSKVVPIKPDERSAGVLHRSKSVSVVAAADSGRKNVSGVVADYKPMQSTEVSASTQWFRV